MTNSVSLNSNIDLTGILKYFSNGYKVDGVIGYNFDIDGLLPRTVQIKNKYGYLESFDDINTYLLLNDKPTSSVEDITQDSKVMSAFNNAFSEISKVAAIDFDPNVSSQDSFLYISQVEDISAIAGIGAFPSQGNTGGIVLVDKDAGPHSYETAPDGGSEYDSLVMHEILHNLGLSHPHDSGANTQVYTGPLDADRYTVMSYNHVFGAHDPIPTAREQYGFALNPMPIDIYALQSLYGERAANTGSTSYKWIAAGETRDLDGSDSSISVGRGLYAIWDTAGDDTLDFSAADGFSLVNLISASMQSISPAETTAMIAALQNSLYWNDQVAVVKNEITSAASATAGYLSSTIRYEVSSYSYVFNPGGFVIAHNSSPALDREIENAIGGEYADVIIGNHRNNVLTGNGGDDLIYGGSGNDTIDGGLGADEIIGGDGSDTASYFYSSIGVNVNLSFTTGQLSGGDAAGDILRSIENLEGSTKTDVLTGSNTTNTINGFNDNDQVFGLDGNDTLLGGQGDDALVGGKGTDVIDGGDDTDTADYSAERNGNAGMTTGITVDLTLTSNQVTNDGFGNKDTLIGIEKIIGSSMADTFTGGSMAFEFFGDGGDDRFNAGTGAEHFDGGSGSKNRVIYYFNSTGGVEVNLISGIGTGGSASGDTYTNIQEVDGTTGRDIIHLSNSSWGYTWTYSGDDDVYGGTTKNGVFDNLIYTREGSDRFYYQAGKATYYGGTDTTGGIDTVDLSLVNDGYKFKLRTSNALITRNDNQHYQQIIAYETEQFVGSKGNDTFEIDNALYTSGNTYDGSDGFNILDMSTEGHVNAYSFNFNLSSGLVRWDNSQNGFTIKNIDKIFATRFNDTFWGGTEEVRIEGGVGDDYLYAGSGIEHFNGGDSAQKSYPLKDTINYQNSTGRVIIDLNSTTTQQGGWAQGDILIDVENIVGSNIQGEGDILTNRNIFSTYINGLAGDDEIFLFGTDSSANGGSGNDEIHLMSLSQEIYGGTGVDTFYINSNSKSGQIYDYEPGEKIVIDGYNQSQIEIRPSYGSHVKGLWIDGQHFFAVKSATSTLQFGYDDLLFV